jgi:hypothetical protein
MKLKMKKLLDNPYYNEKQAQEFIRFSKPEYYKPDTSKNYSKVFEWKSKAKIKNQSLESWLDSMQTIKNKQKQEVITKKITQEIHTIIELIGQNYLKEFSPKLEELIPKLDSTENQRVKIILARFQYKNYESETIKTISEKIEFYLKNMSIKEMQIVFYIVKLKRDLDYINTQKSFCAIAPLLLCKTKVEDVVAEYNFNRVVLEELHSRINNLPITYDVKGNPVYNEKINAKKVERHYYRDEEAPDIFFEDIYNWMLKNVGNYEINNE